MSKIKGFIGETIIYGFANVFSRVFAMILIPFYAEYLGKIDYANLVMLQSLFTILTFMLALNSGVFFYYYEYERLKYRKIVFTSWFYYELAFSLLFILFLFLSSSWIGNFFITSGSNSEEINLCILLVGIQLIPYTFNNTNINLFRIDRKPKMVMIIVFLEALFTLGLVYLALFILNYGLAGVVVGQIAARSLVVLLFLKTSAFYINFKNYSNKLLKKILVYTWPFFIISIFGWLITSMDKFIGAQTLLDKSDVAILSLSMQLVIPIVVLADMIRMAVGPFVMSIHKESDADKTYQQIYDLSIFASCVVVVLVIAATPFLTLILTNASFLTVIDVVPLMALASIFSLAANQFSISFNLVKKNVYILYATVLAGIFGIIINYFFMGKYGFVVSGYSQIISYLVMGIFLYIAGRKVAKQKIALKNSIFLLLPVLIFILFVAWDVNSILNGNYLLLIIVGIITLILLSLLYMKSQKLTISLLVKGLLNRK